ncbi:hypothetical protein vseg_008444 [Gypsophila vaccaria]
MPLTDLLEMTNEKVDATQQRASNNSYHPPPRPETDFCELVWENGQIMIQGQTSKARNGPLTANDYQSLVHNPQDGRDVNGLKMNKFSTMDSVMCDMGLGQDVDVFPWLSYSAEDPLHNDYNCEFLPELSGITINDVSTDNHLAFREKKSGCHGDDHPNAASLKHVYVSKVGSNTARHSRGENSGVAQFLFSSQNNVPKSGVSDITGDYVGNTQNVDSQDLNASSLCAFTRSRLQKLDAVQPSTSASFTNFPYFSRSAALAKANHAIVNNLKRPENDEQRCTVTRSIPTDSTLVNLVGACSRRDIGVQNQSVQAPVDDISRSLPIKPTEELVLSKRTSREEDDTNDATKSKVGMGGERNMEPVVTASSVCSGNSVDRASNERECDLKRKSRETTESEGPSDEVEGESVRAKKAAHARASSKRSRAAEVHNLSERKRRDRINEKMRALQELIPNCNKVDKASMLDEAIDYLKTLQLQVQMMSMGAGLYMQPMMLPPGMQPIHGTQMSHFSPMGLGMGMGMGFGMNMLDMNSGMKMAPYQGPHYPPGAAAQFHGLSGPSLQPFGHLGQSLQMSMQQAPLQSTPSAPPLNMASGGSNVSGLAGSSGASNLVPSSMGKDVYQQHVRPCTDPTDPMNRATNQATKEGIQPTLLSHDRKQNANASESSLSDTNNVA